jgi:hypothetical protein
MQTIGTLITQRFGSVIGANAFPVVAIARANGPSIANPTRQGSLILTSFSHGVSKLITTFRRTMFHRLSYR